MSGGNASALSINHDTEQQHSFYRVQDKTHSRLKIMTPENECNWTILMLHIVLRPFHLMCGEQDNITELENISLAPSRLKMVDLRPGYTV